MALVKQKEVGKVAHFGGIEGVNTGNGNGHGQVQEQLAMMDKGLAMLYGVSQQLEEKLSLILREQEIKAGTTNGKDVQNLVPLANVLRDKNASLDSIIGSLSGMVERLEL